MKAIRFILFGGIFMTRKSDGLVRVCLVGYRAEQVWFMHANFRTCIPGRFFSRLLLILTWLQQAKLQLNSK